MKKMVCLLLACLMVFANAMAAESCGHFHKYVYGVEYGEPIPYPEGHWIPRWYWYECEDCGLTFKDVEVTYIVQGHNYSLIYENHEGINPILHVAEYRCMTCFYTYRIEYDCGGTGCMIGFYSTDEPCVDH